MQAGHLPPGTTAWLITDGKIGDEVQCLGIADELGLEPQRRLIKPRPPWSWASPWGPVDPGESPSRPRSPIAPPFPDVAIAAGRRTVPYLRRVKRASGGQTFTIFVKDPYTGLGTADVIWIPEHDQSARRERRRDADAGPPPSRAEFSRRAAGSRPAPGRIARAARCHGDRRHGGQPYLRSRSTSSGWRRSRQRSSRPGPA